MSPLLGALLLGAAGAVTWLHLSTRARRRGRPFPSVQHLGGAPLPRRPTWPVEQPVRFLCRLGSLLLLALALWGLGRGTGGDGPRVALVDGASGPEGWRRARELAGVTVVAGFEGAQARVEGEDARAARVRASLEACSARTVDCLLRAAQAGGARPVVVSDFADGGWSAALAGESFDFLRLAAIGGAEAERAPAPSAPAGRSGTPGTPGGTSPPGSRSAAAAASRAASKQATALPPGPRDASTRYQTSRLSLLWRAALEAALPPAAPGSPPRALPDLRLRTEAGPAEAPCPGVEQTEARAVRWSGLSALATGRTAVPADATLRFQQAPGATLQLDGLAARVPDGTLCLAGTDRELGRWAHDGTLAVLGRALAPWVASPLLLREAPPGGTERWLDSTGAAVAVGLADVPLGDDRREDGEVRLTLARPEALAPAPLTDADLVARGGAPWKGGTSTRWPWPLWALLGVALLRLLDWPERRAPSPPGTDISTDISRRYQTPRLASLAILGAAMLGLGWSRTSIPERWIRILGPVADDATAALRRAGLKSVRGTAGLACAEPASDAPCIEVATAAAQLQRGVDTRVRDAAGPHLSLLDVQLPSEVPLGMAAQVRVDVRVEHARGQRLTVAASAPGAPTVTEERSLASDDAVLRLELPLLSATEGVLPVTVSARAGGASDARLRALVVRHRAVRRLLVAGAPSWDARRASEVLDLSPARVDVVTRIGRSATASRPRGLPPPSTLLTSPELDGYASIVLVDPGDWLGPDAIAGLTAWVERGGGLVVLGRARLPPTLIPGPAPAGPAGPPHRLQARWGGDRWSFDGFDPADGTLSPGAVVLGEVGPSERALHPWVVGRSAGQGRVLQLLAEDAWRLSPPGGDATHLEKLLGAAVAWVEAARPTPEVTVDQEARSVLWTDDAGRHRTPFGLGATVLGLPLANLPAALDLPIRLRADAARAGKPWIDVDSWTELGRTWARAPDAPTLRRQELIRSRTATWGVWAALLTAEIAMRRAWRRTAASVRETEPIDVEPLRRSA